jgi:hypothetical protein
MVFCCENRVAVDIDGCPRSYKKLKDVSLRYFYVQHLVEENQVKVKPGKSAERFADGLTKVLEGTQFKVLRERIGVVDHEIVTEEVF